MLTPIMADVLVEIARCKIRNEPFNLSHAAKAIDSAPGIIFQAVERLQERGFLNWDRDIIHLPEPLALRACGFKDAFTAEEIYARRSRKGAA